MSDVADKLNCALEIDFARLAEEGPQIVLRLGWLQAWCLFSQIQLACRHPGNVGQARLIAEEIARVLQADLATTPALQTLANMGWNPVYDQPAPRRGTLQ